MTLRFSFFLLLAGLVSAHAESAGSRQFNLQTATVADLQQAMDRGALTAEKLVELSLARAKAYEPALNAIITLNPRALEEARQLDAERRTKGPRSPVHGIPVVVKDCIDTADLPTSLGFFGLRHSVPAADARVIQTLREGGAIILAKVNLSELASGPTQSSAGGQTRNPHNPEYGAAGSSSGTAAAVAAGYAPLGLATDTTGSARWPATTNGVVGFKPTTGVISCEGVMPSEPSLDVVGPMARSVADVALLLGLLQRIDAPSAKGHRFFPSDYRQVLRRESLRGARIGFLREDLTGNDPEVDPVIFSAVEKLKAEGATIVEVELPFPLTLINTFGTILYRTESRPALDDYLAKRGPGTPRSLAEILAMSEKVTGPTEECPHPNPGRLGGYREQLAGPPLSDPVYRTVRDEGLAFIKASMQALMDGHKLDAIIYPTSNQRIAKIGAAARRGPKGHWGNIGETIASFSGWPDITVPAGLTSDGLPVGLSFTAPEYQDARVLALAYAFEQATHAIRQPAVTPPLPGESFAY